MSETTPLGSRNETTQLVSRNETTQLCTAVDRLQPPATACNAFTAESAFSTYFRRTLVHKKLKSRKNQDTSLLEQEQLIELSTDSMLKCRYKREDLDFWLKIHKEYSQISTKATKALMPFVATYLTKNPFQHKLEEKQNIGIS
ncbi:hypothetical protein TNCV_3911701 [Trichonephila clavipes]|nr:hypothetical protein TNCV_3911701 [Trichonephila clavipes]